MARSTFKRDTTEAWKASRFAKRRSWAMPLTPAMIGEIDEALATVAAKGRTGARITFDDFPLPQTSELLERALDSLESGPGFAVLAGFPVERYSDAQNRSVLCGVSAHLGHIVEQNHKGDRLIDVVDKGLPYDHTQRGYHSDKALPYHTDGADYVGLMCLGTAAHGGISLLISAQTVHDTIAGERPDLLETLYQGFYHHRRGEEPEGEPPVSPARIPVFSVHDGLLHCCYNRNPIEWAQREGVVLSERETEALDFFDSVCRRPGVALRMDMQPGDLQFVNNYTILHSRTDYVDGPDHKRHLVRIWLNNPASRRAGLTILNLYAPRSARAQIPL